MPPSMYLFPASLFLALLLTSATTRAEFEYPGSKKPTKLEIDPETGNPMLVWLAYKGFEPFLAPDAESKRATPKTAINFMQSFRVAGFDNKKDFHFLVKSKDGKTISEEVGWVPGRYLVTRNQALQKEKTKIDRKALIVNKLESLKGKLNVLKVLPFPRDSEEEGRDEPHRLYTTLFIFGEADGYYLVGEDPRFDSTEEDSVLARSILGWIHGSRVAAWDTREGLEWNHETSMEPKDRPTYILKDPRKKNELPRRTATGRIYKTVEEARKAAKDGSLKGIFEESFEKDEVLGYEISPRLDPDAPRFPVLETLKEEEDIKRGLLFKVGGIGALCDESGKPILSAGKVKKFQDILNVIREQTSQTEILFVIDDTESVDNRFDVVASTVREIAKLAKKDRRKVRVAVTYYNDTDKRKAGDPRLKSPVITGRLEDVIENGNVIAARVQAHKRDGGGDPHEMVFRGIIEGFDAAGFSPHARKMLLVLGDCGDISAHKERLKTETDYGKKYNIEEIIRRLIPTDLNKKSPIEFYAVQVVDPTKRTAYADFREQMKTIAKKCNEALTKRKKAQLADKFDARTVQESEYFGPNEPLGSSVNLVIEERYKKLLAEAAMWDLLMKRSSKGQWLKTKLTPEMETLINKRLQDLKTEDGKPVTLQLLRQSGGLQLFETGYVWEKSLEGIPQIRKRVLIKGSELLKLKQLLSDLNPRSGKNLTIAKLMAGVIEEQANTGDRKDLSRLKNISLDLISKQWTGLNFRTALLSKTYEDLKDRPDRVINTGEYHALMHIRDLLDDIEHKKRRMYDIETFNQAGQTYYKFIRTTDKEAESIRSFNMGNDTSILWYYLDYESEWP